MAASTNCFDTTIFCDRRHRDFRETVSHRSPVPSNVSSKKTRSNMTSVLFKKEYVTQDLYIILYIDLEGNEAQRN